jgi:hypothetical protein
MPTPRRSRKPDRRRDQFERAARPPARTCPSFRAWAHDPRTAFALALCLALATSVRAAEIKGTPQPDGQDIVSISGVIKPGDDQKFTEVAGNLRDITITLNSIGGLNQPAANIGSRIRSLGWETAVRNGAACNSACALIWFAGVYRHLDRRARLGLHSASTESTGKRHEEANRKIAIYLKAMGAPQEVIDLQSKADPCCINYIDYTQAKAWGLLNERPAKKNIYRPGEGVSIETLPTRDSLEDRPPPMTVVPPNPHALLPPWVQLPTWRARAQVLPPPEYDHPYDGELIIARDVPPLLMRLACRTFTGPFLAPTGCAGRDRPSPGQCTIILAPVSYVHHIGWRYDYTLRHEIGHCNGWPKDHSGGLLAGTPAPDRGRWPSDLRGARAIEEKPKQEFSLQPLFDLLDALALLTWENPSGPTDVAKLNYAAAAKLKDWRTPPR